MRRTTRTLVILPLLALILAGCTGFPPGACPAVGYGTTLTIKVKNPAVHSIECVEGCTDSDFIDDYNGWQISFMSGPADEVTLSGLDASGNEVVRETVTPEWHSEDPGNRCGSNRFAEVELG